MKTFLSTVLIPIQVVLIAGLADFIAGVVHWAEDAYFTEDTPFIGTQIIRPNIVHHHFPRYFTKLSWWESSAILVFASLVILAIAWPLGLISWQLILFAVISINANEIHKMTHRTRAENGWFISKLQDWRILQTPHHHGLHHSDPKNTYYCPVTNYVNPILERIDFWTHAESCIEHLTGATHRPDTAVRGQGPGPNWLVEFRPKSHRMCAAKCSGCLLCQKPRNADSRAA